VDLVAAIERESAALLDAATSLGVDVPACPGWDVAELVRHVGSAHRNAARIVGEQLQAHPVRAELEAPEAQWATQSPQALAVLREAREKLRSVRVRPDPAACAPIGDELRHDALPVRLRLR
jgi:hypothetical protein